MKLSFASITMAAIVASATLLVSCGSLPGPSPEAPQSPRFHGSDLAAEEGESEIILNTPSNSGTLTVYVNGMPRQTMRPRDSVKLIVPDGRHTLLVNWATRVGGENVHIRGEPVTITAESRRYVFNVSLPEFLGDSAALLIGKRVELARVGENALVGARATRTSRGIGGATIRASEAMLEDIPGGATIAVLNISSHDVEMADAVINEIERVLHQAGVFTVVTRSRMDSIRFEQNLGVSGEISDETAASIGNMLGANVIVTGSIGGSGATRALRLQALDVRTGRIVAMPRAESF
ncbi:MAG: CsgG/HfaB family protein [Treponema sp.]|nr:CsgG/HfaB family protein [Treponema sp.]